ncbi:archaemetzincin-2-like [Ostrea edulis]|uniref:archaemetzincin-2-like n=1 Tax=Ostrea edulis TaxID=37623 RepID=UPI0024AE929F|nr:archaemetzincin-2-like [Ostrea edulis]
MGSSSSRNTEASKRRYLIGTLDRKSPVEQKFYGLCQLLNLNVVCQNKETNENGNRGTLSSRQSVSVEFCSDGCKLFKPLFLSKPLYFYETFVSWRAHYDVEQLQMRLMRKKESMCLVPIGSFPSFVMDFKLTIGDKSCSLFDILQMFLEIFYQGMPVVWLNSVDPEKENWNITTRNHKVTGKKQCLTSDFYPRLKKWKPRNCYCIMGLTWTDLYPTENLNFVLGEASKRHRSGVFSFGRFEPKSYDKENTRDIEEIDVHILWKLLKVSSHELGHLFGISHCDFFLCGMNGSSSVEEAMSQPLFFCPVCIRKLQHACKFDIVQRYRSLRQFFHDLNKAMPCENFEHNVEWLESCLTFLLEDS